MTDAETKDSAPQELTEVDRAREVYEGAHRKARRIINVLLFSTGFLIFVPMVVGAVTGVQDGEVWDPLTGLSVTMDEDLHCVNEAGDLLYLAGAYGEYDGRWEQRFRRWRTNCQKSEPELQMLLSKTRERLRGEQELPELDIDPASR